MGWGWVFALIGCMSDAEDDSKTGSTGTDTGAPVAPTGPTGASTGSTADTGMGTTPEDLGTATLTITGFDDISMTSVTRTYALDLADTPAVVNYVEQPPNSIVQFVLVFGEDEPVTAGAVEGTVLFEQPGQDVPTTEAACFPPIGTAIGAAADFSAQLAVVNRGMPELAIDEQDLDTATCSVCMSSFADATAPFEAECLIGAEQCTTVAGTVEVVGTIEATDDNGALVEIEIDGRVPSFWQRPL